MYDLYKYVSGLKGSIAVQQGLYLYKCWTSPNPSVSIFSLVLWIFCVGQLLAIRETGGVFYIYEDLNY